MNRVGYAFASSLTGLGLGASWALGWPWWGWPLAIAQAGVFVFARIADGYARGNHGQE